MGLAPDTLPAGTRLGPWIVERPLGRGGMGVVYRASSERGEAAAVKVLAADLARDLEVRERFHREATEASKVHHPGVVRCLGSGRDGGREYLALELVTGGSLADRIARSGPLPWRDAARLGAEIARALEAVHEAGLLHRDLKPANVLLDEAGRAKLADFGLVGKELVGPGRTERLTRTGELVGTVEYMSPEQAEGAARIDARSDLYALGCTLFCALVGVPPFPGSGMGVLARHLTEPPPLASDQVEGVAPALDQLVDRLLSKSPSARPHAARDVADELEAIVRAAPAKAAAGRPRPGLAAVAVVAAVGTFVVGAGLAVASRQPGPAASPSPEPPRPSSPAPSRPGTAPSAPVAVASPELPAWFAGMPEASRPKLPQGLRPRSEPFEYEGPRGDVFVYVPGGTVTVGRKDEPGAVIPNDHPIRTLELSPYFLGKYEVSVAQWRRFDRETRHETLARRLRREGRDEPGKDGVDEEWWPGPKQLEALDELSVSHIAHYRRPGADWEHPHGRDRGEARSEDPVTQIDWLDACAYARWAGARLPSDAEWEAAANGGGTWDVPPPYPWGTEDDVPGHANCLTAESARHALEEVTSRPAGAAKCGALHMSGNVAELVLDACDPNGFTLGTPRGVPVPKDPCYFRPELPNRVSKGGCYWDDMRSVRCDSRTNVVGSDDATGFRLAVSAAGSVREWEGGSK